MSVSRRQFLRASAAAAPLLLWGPSALAAVGRDRGAEAPVLVLIELNGGNDGLNTVIPYADPAYARLRPRLGIARDQVLQLDGALGLHPALEPLMGAWKAKELAVVSGLGYPEPDRSHFRSIDIWETASDSDEYLEEGWLTRVLGTGASGPMALEGLAVGDDPGPFVGRDSKAIVISTPGNFIALAREIPDPPALLSGNPALDHILGVQRDVREAARVIETRLARGPEPGVEFPRGAWGKQLEVAARFIVSGVPFRALKVQLGGFDTHANQLGRHARLLGQLATGLAALRQALQRHGRYRSTLIMTYSEFGRRVAENGSGGTDHGTAAPHFVMGGGVKGGLYGQQPSLVDLQGGDLRHHLDFRRLYATVAERWLGVRGAFPGQRALAFL